MWEVSGLPISKLLRATGAVLVLSGTLGFVFVDIQSLYVASWLAVALGMVLYLVGHVLRVRRNEP